MIHVSKFKVRELTILYGILSRKIKTNKTKLSVPLGKKKKKVNIYVQERLERVHTKSLHHIKVVRSSVVFAFFAF